MAARTNTDYMRGPPPQIQNTPIVPNRNVRVRPKKHHCPDTRNGHHVPTHLCLNKGHMGYCEPCGIVGSPWIGCNSCGTHEMSKVPPSMIGEALGAGSPMKAIVADGASDANDKENDPEASKGDENKIQQKVAAMKEKVEKVNKVSTGEEKEVKKERQRTMHLRARITGLVARKKGKTYR